MGLADLFGIADQTNRWQIRVSFSFEVCWGTAGICQADPWGPPKLSSSGLATSMTNLIDCFIQQIFRLAYGSVLVLSVLNLMFRSGLVDT